MERLKLAGFGRNGAVLDIAEYDAVPESFNEVRNVRFNSTGAVSFPGHKSVLSPAPITPLWLRVFPPVDFPRWVYADLSKVYVFDDGHIDISRPGGYAGTLNERWQGEVFNGVGIFNNTVDVPQMWTSFSSSTQLQDLTNWPANLRSKFLRPFKNYLIAGFLTEDGNDHPFRVRWSHPADPGTVPLSWAVNDPAVDSGEFELAETTDYIVDGKTLGEAFMVYKQKNAHLMYLTGGQSIFGQRTVIFGRGALTRDCVQDIPGGHFVAGLDDIYVHTGQKGSEQSVVEAKVRKWIYNQIDASNFFNCYTVDYTSEKEIWFCFPEAGETYPTIAMIWNKVTGGIGFRDLQRSPFIWAGPVDERTQDGDIWDQINPIAGPGSLTSSLPTIIGAGTVEVADTGFTMTAGTGGPGDGNSIGFSLDFLSTDIGSLTGTCNGSAIIALIFEPGIPPNPLISDVYFRVEGSHSQTGLFTKLIFTDNALNVVELVAADADDYADFGDYSDWTWKITPAPFTDSEVYPFTIE